MSLSGSSSLTLLPVKGYACGPAGVEAVRTGVARITRDGWRSVAVEADTGPAGLVVAGWTGVVAGVVHHGLSRGRQCEKARCEAGLF